MLEKRYLIIFLFLLTTITPFVSGATPFDSSMIKETFYSLLNFFFGEIGNNELVFIKFLVFLLLLVIVKYSLSRIPGLGNNKFVVTAATIVISLMAVRYLTTNEIINFIWLPYGVLGIALSSIFPLVIFFFFIENIDSALLRRVGWVTFIIIYLALAIYRWDSLAVGNEWWNNLGWWYILIACISFLILVFERSIRIRMIIGMIRRGEDTHNLLLRSELQQELRRITSALAIPGLSHGEAARLREEQRRIEAAIARIH